MSRGRTGKPNRTHAAALACLLLALLGAVGLVLRARLRQAEAAPPAPTASPAPAAEAAPTPVPTPEPTPEPTPCPHDWSGGVCALCGEVCPHEAHDAESAVCLVCGEPVRHRYVDGVCAVCGKSPVVYTEPLPARYYQRSDTPGTHRRESYPYNGRTYPLAVWLPHDYREDISYNVILLMPGDKSYYNAWIDMDLSAPGGGLYCMSDVFDHIAEEKLCDPFIVVGISNYFGVEDSVAGRWICEGVLPYVAEHYATFAADGSAESLKAAREHFAIGGLSRGSIQTYSIGMGRCLEYFANFACFSNMSDADAVARRLNDPARLDLDIRCWYVTWGLQDKESYQRGQEEGFHSIVERVERLTEGENAFAQAIDAGHNWDTWSTSFFNAIQFLF